MITYKEACRIAKAIKQEKFPDFTYVEVTDISDRWAFLFSIDAKTLLTPAPTFFIFKEDGHFEWFSIPPLENLELILAGKEIAFLEDA